MIKITAGQIAPVEVKQEKDFFIELDEIPGSGYKWSISNLPHAVKLVEDHLAIPENSSIGGGGKRTFILKPILEGEYILNLRLGRSWVHGPSLKQFTLIIHVKNPNHVR